MPDRSTRSRATQLQRALALTVIAAGGAGFYWLHFGSELEWTQEAFQRYVSDLGALGPAILVGIMAVRPFLALPSGLILLTAGVLFGTAAGALYGALGGTLGALLALGVARALGRDAVQRRIGGKLAAFDSYLRRHGAPWLAAYTAIPISVLSPVYFTAGVTRIRATPFAGAIAVGFVPRAGLYTFLGNTFREPTFGNLAVASGLIILAVIAILLARRHLFPAVVLDSSRL
jgi:uncharacterized membrane protein YdjX (TVP38/TMEM64 family)